MSLSVSEDLVFHVRAEERERVANPGYIAIEGFLSTEGASYKPKGVYRYPESAESSVRMLRSARVEAIKKQQNYNPEDLERFS